MGDGIVVDADIISCFCKECINESGDVYDLIENILENCGIAITELLEQVWRNTCGSQLFEIWFYDNVHSLRIQHIKPQLPRPIVRKIHNDFGLPRRGRDIELIRISNVTKFKYILTYDIDLFDPKKKKASKIEKEHVKNERKGALCQFLRKNLGIIVGLPEHCVCDLSKHLS